MTDTTYILRRITPDSGGLRAFLLAMLVLSSVFAIAAAPAAAAANGPQISETTSGDSLETADSETWLQAENETDDGDDELEQGESANGPTDASQVRINPDMPDADFVGAEILESDESFNTTGSFLYLSLTHPVESARIPQPGAEATIVGEGTVIRVDFDEDAARGDSQTLFALELFFPDESTKSVDVFATNTALSAETTIDPAYESVIEYLNDQATEEGYDESPDGLTNYVKDTEERAELFEGLWTDSIEMFVSLRIAQAFSPFDWVAFITIAILVTLYMNRRFGWVSKAMNLDISKSVLTREAVRQEHERNRKASAKHRLEDVDTIGHNASRYWRSELGVETVDDMCEIACKGIVATDDNGRILTDSDDNDILSHHGIADLDVEPFTHQALREDTWLKPLLLEGRLAATTVLSNIESALHTAETQYGRAGQVREDRLIVEEMIATLTGDRTQEEANTSTFGAREDYGSTADLNDAGNPAGGD